MEWDEAYGTLMMLIVLAFWVASLLARTSRGLVKAFMEKETRFWST